MGSGDRTAERLTRVLQGAGVSVISVTIIDAANKATWMVTPSSLQAAAQPIIDAFNANDPAFAITEADAKTDAVFADIIDDVLTALIEQWDAMHAESTAGTLKGNASLYKQRIRSRVRVLRRAKPPTP